MILYNKKEVQQFLDKMRDSKIHTSAVIFRSPLTSKLEERHIYADDWFECKLWADNEEEKYSNTDFAYVIYRDDRRVYKGNFTDKFFYPNEE